MRVNGQVKCVCYWSGAMLWIKAIKATTKTNGIKKRLLKFMCNLLKSHKDHECSTQGEARASLLNELSLSQFLSSIDSCDLSTQQWADLKKIFNLLLKTFMNEKDAVKDERKIVFGKLG